MPGSAGVAPQGQTLVLDKPDLSRIIDRLWNKGYTVVGPTIAQGGIVFDEVRTFRAIAHRLDRRAGGRNVPAPSPRRRGLFRLRGRTPFVEEVPFPRATDPVLDRANRGFVLGRTQPRPGSEATRSWESARATCTRSRSRIERSCTGLMSSRTTRPDAIAPSSSRSIAGRRRRRVSVPACGPVPRRCAGSTSR